MFDLDERIILFEKESLRLRKGVQAYVNTTTSSSTMSITTNSVSKSNSTTGIQGYSRSTTATNHSIDNNTTQAIANNNSHINLSTPLQRKAYATTVITSSQPYHPKHNANTSNISTNSVTGSITKKTGSPNGASTAARNTIYEWEGQSESDRRMQARQTALIVDHLTYCPSATNGFYRRTDEHEEQFDNIASDDKFIDFQIILTKDEISALAARKRSLQIHTDKVLHKSTAASKSVHAATPYIDQYRITKELMRPNKPEKWVHPTGLRPVGKYT